MGDVIGDMRERIQIAVRGGQLDDKFNGEVKTWTLSDPIWAKVEEQKTGTDEVFTANQKTPDAKVDFTVRFLEVAYTSEVEYRGKRYKIEGVANDAKRAFTTIETKLITN